MDVKIYGGTISLFYSSKIANDIADGGIDDKTTSHGSSWQFMKKLSTITPTWALFHKITKKLYLAICSICKVII